MFIENIKKLTKVSKPRPPHSIISARTTCPKTVRSRNGSIRVSPVTQVAEVAVYSAVSKLSGSFFAENGIISSTVPAKMTHKKLTIIFLAGENALSLDVVSNSLFKCGVPPFIGFCHMNEL